MSDDVFYDLEEGQGQLSYLLKTFENNAKKLNVNKLEGVKKFKNIKYGIENCLSIINEELAQDAFKNPENVFPWWYKLKSDPIEYEKDGDFYIRCHEKYQDAMDKLLSVISNYIKEPVLRCDVLDAIFLKLFLFLKEKLHMNKYGFKALNKTSGWRYNLLGCFIGEYGWTFLAGILTSGFVLFPIVFLCALLMGGVNSHTGGVLLVLSVILFLYKVARFIFDTVFYKLGFKNSIQKEILPFAEMQQYVYNNDVLQPSKLKELADKTINTPAAISVLIKNMMND
jgi:hypothetical protein